MVNLKEYIKEGLFDDLDKIEKIGGMESNVKLLKKEITDWITNNTYTLIIKSRLEFDFNTTPITVNYDDDIYISKSVTSLNDNGLFQWGEVGGGFYCTECKLLKSLEGAPKEVGGDFNCFYCPSLKTLEGSPGKVGNDFACNHCKLLKTLKGAPKDVGGYFNCSYCESLKSLEGCPKEVGWYFNCSYCGNLKSLKSAPKEVGRDFYCSNCGTQFSEEDVKKVTNVKRYIYC